MILDSAGQVVGEGWHEYDLLDHAEIAALKEARQHAADRVHGGTAYVTLEPCSITGRTPPCTDALIKAGLARVVAATIDPNPAVAGHGLDCTARRGHSGRRGRLPSRGPPPQRRLRALDSRTNARLC